ncbi:MAG: FHA domain-containing protein [Deltaproteobacteria bacterium]|nr:MAG: FHA domain-containing protein [Deltaproteobacteria bacterium]
MASPRSPPRTTQTSTPPSPSCSAKRRSAAGLLESDRTRERRAERFDLRSVGLQLECAVFVVDGVPIHRIDERAQIEPNAHALRLARLDLRVTQGEREPNLRRRPVLDDEVDALAAEFAADVERPANFHVRNPPQHRRVAPRRGRLETRRRLVVVGKLELDGRCRQHADVADNAHVRQIETCEFKLRAPRSTRAIRHLGRGAPFDLERRAIRVAAIAGVRRHTTCVADSAVGHRHLPRVAPDRERDDRRSDAGTVHAVSLPRAVPPANILSKALFRCAQCWDTVQRTYSAHLDAMPDDLYTIADPTVAADTDTPSSGQRAQLVVYYDQDTGARTRLVDLPDGAQVTFGRSRSATIHIDSDRVSRQHARIDRRGRDITIEDLGSRNGTRVNGKLIDGPTRLASGDEIAVGPVTAVVSITTHMARTTPVGSTTSLEERLIAECDRGMRYQRTLALVMVRLDGDEPRAEGALERIARHLRPMDTLAEYGPDEFAILLPELDSAAAEDAARRVARDARGDGDITGRVGLAVFPTHGTTPGELLSRASAALRAARADDRGEVASPPDEPARTDADVIVADPQMERVYQIVNKVADTPMTVLITGETGVGKEVVAEALHRHSRRRDKPFVRLNCASIPETLLESELFGHEKGAFTGADRRKLGYFEAADGGTLFLDEIGEISPGLQSKLLRVLEEHRFTRVGGTSEIGVDVRVVCATNRDLEAEVQRGAFREDLFFRISAFTIVVPPLRDRRGEIVPLAEHFLRQAARELGVPTPMLSPDAADVLRSYHWPGNVRQLRNAMERAIVLNTSGVIEVHHLPDRIREQGLASPLARSSTAGAHEVVDVRERIADVERAAIVAALEATGGNQTRAARKLGLSRRALIYKLEKYGLKPKPASARR